MCSGKKKKNGVKNTFMEAQIRLWIKFAVTDDPVSYVKSHFLSPICWENEGDVNETRRPD